MATSTFVMGTVLLVALVGTPKPKLGAASTRRGDAPSASVPVDPGKGAAMWMPVSPPWVLPGQPPDQITDLLQDRRVSRDVRVGPFVLDDAPVPGEQSVESLGHRTEGSHWRARSASSQAYRYYSPGL